MKTDKAVDTLTWAGSVCETIETLSHSWSGATTSEEVRGGLRSVAIRLGEAVISAQNGASRPQDHRNICAILDSVISQMKIDTATSGNAQEQYSAMRILENTLADLDHATRENEGPAVKANPAAGALTAAAAKFDTIETLSLSWGGKPASEDIREGLASLTRLATEAAQNIQNGSAQPKDYRVICTVLDTVIKNMKEDANIGGGWAQYAAATTLTVTLAGLDLATRPERKQGNAGPIREQKKTEAVTIV